MVTLGLESVLRQAAAALPVAIENAGQLQTRESGREIVPSGVRSLDALLPAGGVRRGSLVEWLAVSAVEGPGHGDAGHGDVEGLATIGSGAATLAGAVACRLAAARPAHTGAGGGPGGGPRVAVVVDRSGWFHPPALLPWLGAAGGPDARQLVVVRPSCEDDEIWAIDQALRCPGVAAVLAWPRSLVGRAAGRSCRQSLHQWTVAMRRWQLAARASGAVGLFVRPQGARREPTWAEARIAVAALPGGALCERRLRLTRIGGAWNATGSLGGGARHGNGAWFGDGERFVTGAETGRTVDIVLDMARGCETTVGSRTPPAHGERGASCRAS